MKRTIFALRRSAAAVALVVIAVLGGGLLALAPSSAERELSVGRIELRVYALVRFRLLLAQDAQAKGRTCGRGSAHR